MPYTIDIALQLCGFIYIFFLNIDDIHFLYFASSLPRGTVVNSINMPIMGSSPLKTWLVYFRKQNPYYF